MAFNVSVSMISVIIISLELVIISWSLSWTTCM